MLEIVAIIALSNRISRIVREKGLKPAKYIIIAIILCISFEFIGAVFGFLVLGMEDSASGGGGLNLWAYPFAIAGAAVGGFLGYYFAKRATPKDQPNRFGCGLLLVISIGFAIMIIIIALIFSPEIPSGGVKVSNQMEQYALDYIEDNRLLEADEKILAYYDFTVDLDGSEAVILTDQRLIYHGKEIEDFLINLEDIVDVQYRQESLGDIIEVYVSDGNMILLEIPLWDDGEILFTALNFKLSQIQSNTEAE